MFWVPSLTLLQQVCASVPGRASVTLFPELKHVQLTQTADVRILPTRKKVWKHNRLHAYVSTWTWAIFFFFPLSFPVKDRRGRRRWLHFPHYFLGRLPKSSGAQRASPPFKGVGQIAEKPCRAAWTETGTADVKHTVNTPQNQTALYLSWYVYTLNQPCPPRSFYSFPPWTKNPPSDC